MALRPVNSEADAENTVRTPSKVEPQATDPAGNRSDTPASDHGDSESPGTSDSEPRREASTVAPRASSVPGSASYRAPGDKAPEHGVDNPGTHSATDRGAGRDAGEGSTPADTAEERADTPADADRETASSLPPFVRNPLSKHVDEIVNHANYLTAELAARLAAAAPEYLRLVAGEAPVAGEEIDLREELRGSLRLLQQMRTKLVNNDGTLKEGYDVKDVKDAVSSTSSLISMLMKYSESFDRRERMAAMEQATIDTVKDIAGEYGEDVQKRFLDLLEKRFDRLNQ